MKAYQTIIEPITTEKSTILSDKGKYVFKIRKNSTKVDVKKAIKAIYDTDVEKVTISYVKPKTRLVRGRHLMVKRNPLKKATVTIKNGKTIDITKFKEPKKKK